MKYRIVQIYPNEYPKKYQIQEEYDKPSRELYVTTYQPIGYSKDWRPLNFYKKLKDGHSVLVPTNYCDITECKEVIKAHIEQRKKLDELNSFKPFVIFEHEEN